MSWVFLLEVLEHMGFGRHWRNWVSTILRTTSTKILLKGQLGRRICHARGLRQGEPLSPKLFMLVMEVINHMLQWLDSEGLLTGLGNVGIQQRASLYADDLILFVVPNETDLVLIRSILQIFGLAFGLFANLDKSVATPLHYTVEDIHRVQEILSYRSEDFPSCYLDIPPSVFGLKKGEE